MFVARWKNGRSSLPRTTTLGMRADDSKWIAPCFETYSNATALGNCVAVTPSLRRCLIGGPVGLSESGSLAISLKSNCASPIGSLPA